MPAPPTAAVRDEAVSVAAAVAAAVSPSPAASPVPPFARPAAPALQHLGVVGIPGTVGAAVGEARSRAAAERRFHGSDPRARLIDPRHPAAQRRRQLP